MNKKVLLFAICFVIIKMTFAQDYRPATPEQQKELMQNIAAASKQMKTLQCDFVQKMTISILADEMLLEGKLLFKQDDKLCWEYIKPYRYRFTLNGNKVMIDTENNKDIFDANSNKIFKEISKLIISGINGSGIFEEDKFAARFNVGAQDHQVILTPRQRELRQLFSNVTITFNKADYTVNTVEIKELSGDTTLITMKNKQINKEIDDEIFAIR